MKINPGNAVYLIFCQIWMISAVYSPLREYSGQNFFSQWDFYGAFDNLSNGDVFFLDQSDATTQQLAFINDAGNAIIKVDNTSTVQSNDKRNSVRITTKDQYSVGTLVVIDAVHLPYGCSVWPAFWTQGVLVGSELWPAAGEIDIIEGVNLMQNNQMALHSGPSDGCAQPPSVVQSGKTKQTNCTSSTGNNAGCAVVEMQANSFGEAFAQAGGGVFAMQFDVTGVFMWFWSRPNVPASITQATSTSTVDTSTWGTPSGSWPATSCNITEFFGNQQLVLDITLCGSFAGGVYTQTCSTTPTDTCYADNVVGPGNPTYNNAYFEIPYIRTYTAGTPPPSSSSTPQPSGSTSNTGPSPTSASGSNAASLSTPTSAPASSGLRIQNDAGLGLTLMLLLAASFLGFLGV